jgi:hypothetical protein
MGIVMKYLSTKAMLAGAAALAFAGAAHASVTVTWNPAVTDYASDVAAVPDSQILWDFDTIFAPGYNYVPLTAQAVGNVPNVTLQPKGDTTVYGSVNPGNSPAVFTTPAAGLKTFSLLVGSMDTFNRIQFIATDGVTVLGDLTGSTGLFGSYTPINGANVATRFTYTFGGAAVGTVNFYSSVNSHSYAFEFDRISGAVPEPAAWAMMILGFFGLGATLRSRKMASAIA